MTYGEILAEIRMWVSKGPLTQEEYERLEKLTIEFCRGYPCKWDVDIMRTMNQVLETTLEQSKNRSDFNSSLVIHAITHARGNHI